MGTKLHYKPGSFYRCDDLTGFSERAEHTKKTWQGYYVRPASFEPRNAQDMVRGRRDDQTVPDARPRQTNIFLGESSTLASAAAIRATGVFLSPIIPFAVGDIIEIMLDDGTNFYTTVTAVSGDFNSDFSSDFSQTDTIMFASPIPFQASAGNAVINASFVPVQAAAFPSGGVS